MLPISIITLEVFLFSFLDKKMYGTYYTPTIFLGIPYVVILILHLLTADYIGFYGLYTPSIYVWCLGLFIFWITGVLLSILFVGKTITNKNPFTFPISISTEKIILFLGVLTAIISDINIYRGYRIFGGMGSEEFEAFLGTGITAHIAILLRFISVFSFVSISFSKEKRKRFFLHLFVIISALLFCMAYTTKSALLITFLSGVLARLMIRNKKIKIKWILPAIILAFLVFFVSYSIVFGYAAPIDFILNHILFYFTSSIAGLSYYVQHDMSVGISMDMLFMPIINLFNKLLNQPVNEVVSQLWTPVGTGQSSNVKTFFGTIYIYGGVWGGILTILIWSFFCHSLLILSRKKNIFFFLVYTIFLASLLFGWFDLYLNTIAFYEFMLYSIIFGFFYSIRRSFR